MMTFLCFTQSQASREMQSEQIDPDSIRLRSILFDWFDLFDNRT